MRCDEMPPLLTSSTPTVYSLEDEQVKAYASQHPFRVVESSQSNHSKVMDNIYSTD